MKEDFEIEKLMNYLYLDGRKNSTEENNNILNFLDTNKGKEVIKKLNLIKNTLSETLEIDLDDLEIVETSDEYSSYILEKVNSKIENNEKWNIKFIYNNVKKKLESILNEFNNKSLDLSSIFTNKLDLVATRGGLKTSEDINEVIQTNIIFEDPKIIANLSEINMENFKLKYNFFIELGDTKFEINGLNLLYEIENLDGSYYETEDEINFEDISKISEINVFVYGTPKGADEIKEILEGIEIEETLLQKIPIELKE